MYRVMIGRIILSLFRVLSQHPGIVRYFFKGAGA